MNLRIRMKSPRNSCGEQSIFQHCNKTYIFQILSKIVETFYGYVPNNDQEYVRDQ